MNEEQRRVKVTVVVPVYNPGPYIDPLIESLWQQTMPAGEYEAVFVDDGSTDATPARLDELAREYDHVRVIHQENSGWPGKPRNVGVKASRGEYVQFVDQDDALGPEALERLYEMAARNDADIVIGKVVGTMAGPHGIFRQTIERCTIADAPLIESLTPHKLFRREFLEQHGLRFAEGKRRLEDQLFMAQAYLAARTVSILADYPCYYWMRRDDGKNTSKQRSRLQGYFDNLREVIDAIEAGTEPGELRDRLLRRPLRHEMLGRLSEPGLLKYSDEYRAEMYEAVRPLALERFSPAVIDGLPPLARLRAKLLLEDRLDGLMELAGRVQAIKLTARLDTLEWRAGELHLAFRLTYRHPDGTPLVLLERDGRFRLDPALTDGVPGADGFEFTSGVDDADINVTLRHRETPVSWYAPASCTVRPSTDPDRSRDGSSDDWSRRVIALSGETRIDPLTLAGGRRLDDGVWDLRIGAHAAGIGRGARLGPDRHARTAETRLPAILGAPALVATPYWSRPRGDLSLDIGERARSLVREIAAAPAPRGRRAATPRELPLPGASAPGTAPLEVDVWVGDGDARMHRTGRLVGGAEGIALTVEGNGRRGVGRWARRQGRPLYIQTRARRDEEPARVGTAWVRGGQIVGFAAGEPSPGATKGPRGWFAKLILHPRFRATARKVIAAMPAGQARLARQSAARLRGWAERGRGPSSAGRGAHQA